VKLRNPRGKSRAFYAKQSTLNSR